MVKFTNLTTLVKMDSPYTLTTLLPATPLLMDSRADALSVAVIDMQIAS